MSRYFQSTYHGSNDYKKYREERLSKNNQFSSLTTSRPHAQNLAPRQQSVKYKPKEHLETFGIETGRQQSRSIANYQKDQNSKFMARQDKQHEHQYISLSNNLAYQTNYDLKTSEDKIIPKYVKERCKGSDKFYEFREEPQYDRPIISQQRQKRASWNYNTMIHKRDNQKGNQSLTGEDFENTIISRSKNYDNYAKMQIKQSGIPPKTYIYSNRLQKQKTQTLPFNSLNYKEGAKESYAYLGSNNRPTQGLTSRQTDTSPYRSRNQIIKQRLNLANNQPASTYRATKKDSFFNDYEQKQFQTKRQQRPSQIKTTQVTPQKSSFSIRDDKNASQQRRKSLIQKSQMLKEKLNRLNASSNTKVPQNQENFGKQKMFNKQNLIQNYTPKRYPPQAFTTAFDNSENLNKSVSKRLKFDEDSTKKGALRHIDRNIYQQKQATKDIYSTNSINKSYNQGTLNQPGRSEVAGEGALKKISQLNERINSRLESILKNYG